MFNRDCMVVAAAIIAGANILQHFGPTGVGVAVVGILLLAVGVSAIREIMQEAK